MGPAFFTTQRHRRDLYFGIPGLKSLAFHWFFVEASFAGPTTPVLVKLVNGGYGVEVHHLLAKHSLTPTYTPTQRSKALRQHTSRPFILEAFVWCFTTSRFGNLNSSRDRKSLQKNGAVHGDLRSPNIMVNVSLTGDIILVEDELGKMRANIRVVDFDWAGDAGQVSCMSIYVY